MGVTGIWRLYRREWTVAYVSDRAGSQGSAECVKVLKVRYDGLDVEWRLQPWSTDDPESWPWMLELNVPVMKGEFRGREHAIAALAAGTGGDVTIVQEGSPEDREMQRRGAELLRKT